MGDAPNTVTIGTESATLVDARGLLCPTPIIRLSKAVKAVEIGQLVKLLATDPGSEPDLKAWEKQTGNTLVTADREGNEFHFVVRRKR